MDDLPGDFLSPLSRGDAVDEFPLYSIFLILILSHMT